jgi:hypothetical protein
MTPGPTQAPELPTRAGSRRVTGLALMDERLVHVKVSTQALGLQKQQAEFVWAQ